MDTIQLNFVQAEDKYISDVITSKGEDIIVYYEFDDPTMVYIERSINGQDWATAKTVSHAIKNEIQITGAIQGQQLRIFAYKPIVKCYYHA